MLYFLSKSSNVKVHSKNIDIILTEHILGQVAKFMLDLVSDIQFTNLTMRDLYSFYSAALIINCPKGDHINMCRDF